MRTKTSLVPVLLAGILAGCRIPQQSAVLYVSPDGNDQWSGSAPARAGDGSDGPLASLPAALDAARKIRSAHGGVHPQILLRGGTYELRALLVLTPEDSDLTIAAYRDEKPVISGGRRVTGWKPVSGKTGWWQAQVSRAEWGSDHFRSLFVNGRRAQRARTPNVGFFRIDGATPQGHPASFHFHPGDIRPEWAADGDAEVIALLAWTDIRMYLRGVDEQQQVATLSTDARRSNKEENARYYIENTPDALDAPGEWHLDRKTSVVTYLARPGEDMGSAEAIAPALDHLLEIRGDFVAKRPVRDVVLRRLTFSYTDWNLPSNGLADSQSAAQLNGDVRAEGATDCLIEDCTFTRLANYALVLGRGCQRDKIVGCDLFDLGAGGIRIGEPRRPSDPFEENHTHVVTDNHIHDGGRVYWPGVGVLIMQSGTNLVAHNEIDHLYYTAISVGWNWGYRETPCRENRIECNHLHDIGQGMLSDMGAVYTLGPQKGTMIRNNLIHDVETFGYGGWGLYTDEGSSDIVWESNVVYRCKSASFHQHYGRDNVIRNNILAFGREHQLMRTRDEAHNSFFLTNNIMYFNSGDVLGSSWTNNNYVVDHNLYWDARPGFLPDDLRFGNDTLEQWRQRGHDVHSIVADPLFVGPERFDFRLRPGSPALKFGFKPIDLSKVGVRERAPSRPWSDR
jgi:hypothetical protein